MKMLEARGSMICTPTTQGPSGLISMGAPIAHAQDAKTAADLVAMVNSAAILLTEAERAALIFREYEAHHLAKPDAAKAARNAAMAGRLERAAEMARSAGVVPK